MRCKNYTKFNSKHKRLMNGAANTNNVNGNSERVLNLIIVDESGSMGLIYQQAFEGMNGTIGSIKERANAIEGVKQYINLITFDSMHYKQHLRHCPAEEARQLRPEEYRPNGGTPLFDAIGRAVTRLERHVTERDAVFVTIITDGEENCSVEFTGAEVKRLVERLSARGWMFTFIGANQDVVMEASRIGIKHSMAFEATPDGARVMWEKENMSRAKLYSRMQASKRRGESMSSIMRKEAEDSENFFER